MVKIIVSHVSETVCGNLLHREIEKTEIVTEHFNQQTQPVKQEKSESTYTFDCRRGFLDMPTVTYLQLREIGRKHRMKERK